MIPPIDPALDPARRPCPSCRKPLGATHNEFGALVCSHCAEPLPRTSLGGGAFKLGDPDAPRLGQQR